MNTKSLGKNYALPILFGFFGSLFAMTPTLSAESYTKCTFQLVDKIGGLYNEWSYTYQRYNREVMSPDSRPMELADFYPLIDFNVRGPIKASYKKTIEDSFEVRKLIVPLTETVKDGFSTWFYHYQRRTWGSGPEDIEVSHEYYIDLDTLSCN
jgi:hypothetical protein